MGERTSYAHGTPSWAENATTDQDAAKSFYASLFGWDYDDSPVGDGVVYSMAKLGDKYVGAISPQMQDERDMGVPPHWNTYITVDDVDAVSARVEALGGTLHAPPFDVMDVGRMSALSDTTGAVFYLWEARSHIGAGLVNRPGAMCWNELATPDPEASQRFYSGLLGWEFDELPIPGNPYWTIRGSGSDRVIGGVREDTQMQSHWLVYFGVDSIDSAAQATTDGGGAVILGKTPANEGNSFAVLQDPVGAVFAVFEGSYDD